jgi:hypothetical protein
MMRSPELGLRDQQSAQLLGRDPDDLDIALRVSIHERAVIIRQRTELTQKLPGALIDDRPDVAQSVARGQSHVSGQHDRHARRGLTHLEHDLAVGVAMDAAEATCTLDLIGSQGWERLIVAPLQLGARSELHRGSVARFSRHGANATPIGPWSG